MRYIVTKTNKNTFGKYLSNNGFSETEIAEINNLITFFYPTHLFYATPQYRSLLLQKVASTDEDFSTRLLAVYNKSKKYKDELYQAVVAYGKTLFAR